MTIAAVTGWPPSELNALTGSQVMRYAVEAADHDGRRLARDIRLFVLPVEAYGGDGKYPTHDALMDEALRLTGSEDNSAKRQARDKQAAQDKREREHISQILAAEKAGDMQLVERLEAAWEQELAERKAAGEAAQVESKWSGNAASLGQFVRINREPAPEAQPVN